MLNDQLTPDALRLLREIITKQQPQLLVILSASHHGTLTVEQREALREALAAELCETGLNDDYEPNERGLQIEKLIDDLGRI